MERYLRMLSKTILEKSSLQNKILYKIIRQYYRAINNKEFVFPEKILIVHRHYPHKPILLQNQAMRLMYIKKYFRLALDILTRYFAFDTM